MAGRGQPEEHPLGRGRKHDGPQAEHDHHEVGQGGARDHAPAGPGDVRGVPHEKGRGEGPINIPGDGHMIPLKLHRPDVERHEQVHERGNSGNGPDVVEVESHLVADQRQCRGNPNEHSKGSDDVDDRNRVHGGVYL